MNTDVVIIKTLEELLLTDLVNANVIDEDIYNRALKEIKLSEQEEKVA